MGNRPEFDKTIEWDRKFKVAKVYLKKDKNGQPFFTGNLGNSVVIHIQKQTGQYAKEGEYIVNFVPVKYTKKESVQENTPEINLDAGTDEIPF